VTFCPYPFEQCVIILIVGRVIAKIRTKSAKLYNDK